MNLLITGGAGFIGSNFIHYWLANHPNDHIINYDKLTYAGNLENLKEIQDNHHYTFVKGDICDEATISQTLTAHHIDTIVHFAAESHVDRSILGPMAFVETNVKGTVTMLEAARKHPDLKRFHHVSTDEVFGALASTDTHKFNEHTNYAPRSPYSASKAASDHFVRAYHTSFNLPVTLTNCSNNYGPYMFPEKLIPLAITNLVEGKKVPVYGKGDQVRDWIHVEDHARAIEAVLLKGTVGETYYAGGMEDEITNLEVVKMICQQLHKNPEEHIEYVKDRPGHDFKYAIDWSKLKNQLDWQPKYTFAQGLQETVQWYVDHQDWWQRVKSGEYQSYYHQQYINR